MKKFLVCILMFCMLFVLSACSSSSSEEKNSTGIDYDLTQMSATMVYSQIFNLTSNPHNYIDKTFKMEGIFEKYLLTQTEQDIYFIVITDATACCPQGIELHLADTTTLPTDYANILIQGNVEMYTAFDGNEYLRINVSSLEEL